jgi:hypothetical protein
VHAGVNSGIDHVAELDDEPLFTGIKHPNTSHLILSCILMKKNTIGKKEFARAETGRPDTLPAEWS